MTPSYYFCISVNVPLLSDLHSALFCRYLNPRILVKQGDDDRVKLGNNKKDEEESELLLHPVLIEMGCPEL